MVSMTSRTGRPHYGLVFGLIVLGVLSRLVPHPWNATPVTAIALFAGAQLSCRWAVLLPLAIVALSDVLLGWHNTVPYTWGSFLLIAWLGRWVGQRPTAGRIASGSLTASVLFFLVTNVGVWAAGDLYARTLAGLWQCFLAAVPFFRGTLAGDLVYTALFFGSFALLTGSRTALQTRQPS